MGSRVVILGHMISPRLACAASALLLAACIDPRPTPPDPPPSRNVIGRLLCPDGAPRPRVLVHLADRQVMTDGAGFFFFAEGPDVFDVATLLPDRSSAVFAFGIRGRYPWIMLGDNAPRGAWSARLAVGIEAPPGRELVLVAGDGGPDTEVLSVDRDRLVWRGPYETRLTVHALVFDRASGTFVAHGAEAVVALNDGVIPVAPQLAAVEQRSVSLAPKIPPGFTLSSAEARVTIGDRASSVFVFGGAPPKTMLYPRIDRARVSLTFRAQRGEETASVTTTLADPSVATVEIALPSAPSLIAPFAWSPAEGTHAYELSLSSVDGRGPEITVLTSATKASLPDTATLGAPLPKGARYVWRVRGYAAADVDALTSALVSRDALPSAWSEPRPFVVE